MKDENYALDLRKIHPELDRRLAQLGKTLFDKGARPASDEETKKRIETVTATVRTYQFEWRYFGGSHNVQAEGWDRLGPDEQLTFEATMRYAILLIKRKGPRKAFSQFHAFRTAARQICPSADDVIFDDILAWLARQGAHDPDIEEPRMRLSCRFEDLPEDDQLRLNAIKTEGLVSCDALQAATAPAPRGKPAGAKYRSMIKDQYLLFAGYLFRNHAAVLLQGGAGRFQEDLLRAYGQEIAARLSRESAYGTLRVLSHAIAHLFPGVDFAWVRTIAAEFKKARVIKGIMALPSCRIPETEAEKIDAAIKLEKQSLRAICAQKKRFGRGSSNNRKATVSTADATARSFRFSMIWFYRAAAHADPHWLALPLEVKITRDAIEALIAALAVTFRKRSIARELDNVRRVFERLYAIHKTGEREQLDWLLKRATKLRSEDLKGKTPCPPVLTRALVTAAEKDLNRLIVSIDINRQAEIPWRSLSSLALDYRNDMTQLIEALVVLRARNLQAMSRGDTLLKGQDLYHVLFDAADVKTRKKLYRKVPKRCTKYLDYWFQTVLPILAPAAASNVVLAARSGKKIQKSGLQKSFPNTTKRLNGYAMPQKGCRTAAGTAAVPYKNTKPGLGQRALDHENPDKTKLFYEGEDDLTAAEILASVMDSIVRTSRQL